MKQEKSSNKPPGVGYQKVLVNIKDTSCSLVMGYPTEEWGELSSPGPMFFQTLTQEVQQTEPINNSVRNDASIIIHVGDTILAAAEEDVIDKYWCLIDNQLTWNTFVNKKYL